MSVYQRRFLSDPGVAVLLNIESVNIIDLTPPSAIVGVGSGTVGIVGEFENGPFNNPTRALNPTNFVQAFGGFGFAYGGVQYQNPCARKRLADGALVPEYWNGNGIIQLNAKTFAGLVVCRADTSVGSVSVARQAYLTGAASFRYSLVAGQLLQLDVGAGPTSASFSATAATVSGSAIGTGALAITAGATLALGYDGAPNFTVTFQGTDTVIASVVARINAFAGFTLATISGSAGTSAITLTGLQQGLGAQVRVVSGSSGVLTALGLTAATTLGTGNVQNIAAVTPQEVTSIVQGAVSNTAVTVDPNGALRIASTAAAGFVVVGSGTTATALGFLPGTEATALGQPILVSASATYPDTNLNTQTLTLQIDAALPAVVTTFTSASMTLAQVVAAINAAFTAAGQGAPVTSDGASQFYVVGPNPGGTVSVLAASAPVVLTSLGLTLGSVTGTLPTFGLLPAGTVVAAANGTQFVTMQDLDFEAAGVYLGASSLATSVLQPAASTYSVKVRFALDDGSGIGVTTGAVTTFASAPAIGAFSVNNPLPLSNALTEAQIDAAYATAIQSTANLNDQDAATINIIYSARQSNVVRAQLRTNALTASSNGMQGRMAILRTPLGTPEATALSNTSQQGVGAYRDQRVVFCYPQASTFVPQIAALGVSGGAGFTSTGNVDVGADGFLAAVMSQLNPEENPGQATTFTTGINGLESSPLVQGFQMSDYIAFKASGICALRMDSGVAIFQSGVTSVLPLVNPSLVTIKRRRMADFIQDSIAISLKEFGKKLATLKRRKAILSEISQFLTALAGGGPNAKNGFPNDPDAQRIQAFAVQEGDQSNLGQGLYRIVLAVQLLPSLDSITPTTTIGETVNVTAIVSPNQVTAKAA